MFHFLPLNKCLNVKMHVTCIRVVFIGAVINKHIISSAISDASYISLYF